MLTCRRTAVLLVCFLATFTALVPAVSAGAATGDYDLASGWTVHGAAISCPNAAPRTIDGKQASAFIQAWYFASIYGTLKEGKPPAGVPQCTFVARDTITYLATDNAGKTTKKSADFQFKAFYVSQGKKAWIGLPPQAIGPGASVPKQKWYIATPRSILAWQGKVGPISNTTTTTTTTTPVKVPDDTSSSSSNSAAVIIAVVAGVAILAVGAVIVRSRRKAGTT
jgi:hypothetical protein